MAAAPVPLGRVGTVLVPLAFVAVIFAALLPHVGVVLTSFSAPGSWYRSVLPHAFTLENYADALGHPLTVLSIRNSLLYASSPSRWTSSSASPSRSSSSAATCPSAACSTRWPCCRWPSRDW